MKNKKGIELSVNFLVTIIIALTIFLFGVKFIYDLASEATELEGLTTANLDDRIGSLLCDSTDKVCIGIDKKIIQRGKFDVFGIKIINVLTNQNSQSFDIVISRPEFPNPSGFTKNNEPIDPANDKLDWKPRNRSITLERNEEIEIAVGIEVPKDAFKGTYIFDVNIFTVNGPYGATNKLYVEVP